MKNKIREAALKRWNKVLLQETLRIPKNKNSLLQKAALCGFIAGDGSVLIIKSKNGNFSRYKLDFFADDKKMLDTYINFIQSIYGKTPTISRRDNVFVARINHRSVLLDLLKYSKFGIYTWSFPEDLFLIKGAKENWLRAFFSAEGYVNDKVIKTQSVNLLSIKRVSDLLNELGISHGYYTYTPKNVNHSTVGMIFIGKRDSRMKYYKKIGFWHNKKEEKLKQTLGL